LIACRLPDPPPLPSLGSEGRASARARRGDRTAGFSLIEVLVAMAVLAIALAAVTKAASEGAGNAGYLRDKTLADWVAMNRIVEMYALSEWPDLGRRRGSVPMAGREWEWTTQVSNTPDEDIRRVEVEVRPEGKEGEPLITRVAFLPRPRAPA